MKYRQCVCICARALPVDIMTVVDHLQQLLLTNVLHHHHGADPEDIREAKVDDAVCLAVISTWRYTHIGILRRDFCKKNTRAV